ncbi:MAG: GNAT family protein [Acidobacteriota bacterium]
MKVEPVVLQGRTIRLEPLTLEHAPGLWPHAGPEVFQWLADLPRDGSYEAFRDWIGDILRKPASLGFAMIRLDTGEPVGASGYLEIRPEHRGLEVGRTWIGKANQGTRVNPESKLLLFQHAFETLGALRVQLKTDLLNLQSQRAIEKLGAVREGVLRRYQIRSNGVIRDTVVYSILAEEWPEVRARLEARVVG